MRSKLDHARGWLLKAESDLLSAKRILEGNGPHDTACFHAQQAIEKYLKACLALSEMEIPAHTQPGGVTAGPSAADPGNEDPRDGSGGNHALCCRIEVRLRILAGSANRRTGRGDRRAGAPGGSCLHPS